MTFKEFFYFVVVLIVWVLIAYLSAKYIGFWSAVIVIFGGISWVAWPKANSPTSIDD